MLKSVALVASGADIFPVHPVAAAVAAESVCVEHAAVVVADSYLI